MKVSVIATVFNEAATIQSLLVSLANQRRSPDEIVIADAGSTDGTRDILAASALDGLRTVEVSGNRSVGRNAAIAASSGDVIATIDAGCVAEPAWLDRLIAPFSEEVSWVAGFYRPDGSTDLANCIGLVMVYVEEEVRKDPDSFLPSARSMAFTRAAWKSVGGFPEHVEFAEDTLYGELLVAAGYKPVPALDAIVRWTPPPNLRVLARTASRWGAGDAEAGIRGWTYKRILVGYGGAAAVTALTAVFAPNLVWLGPLVVLIDTIRRTRHKYRWAPRPSGWIFIPIAHIVSTYGALVGYLARYVRRSQLAKDLGL